MEPVNGVGCAFEMPGGVISVISKYSYGICAHKKNSSKGATASGNRFILRAGALRGNPAKGGVAYRLADSHVGGIIPHQLRIQDSLCDSIFGRKREEFVGGVTNVVGIIFASFLQPNLLFERRNDDSAVGS